MNARSNTNAPHNQPFQGPRRYNTKLRAWYKVGNNNNRKKKEE